jgi:DNA-binding NarL/FixJ family response regulator
VNRPRVLIVDDIEGYRYLYRTLLEADFEIVGAVATGREGVEAAERLQPDIVLIDVQMPGMNGFDTGRELSRRCPQIPFVLVSQYAEPSYADEAFGVGASGFVKKSQVMIELGYALRIALRGKYFRSKSVAKS